MASTPLYLSATGLSSIAPTVGELPSSVDDGGGKIIQWTKDMGGSLSPCGQNFTVQYDVTVD